MNNHKTWNLQNFVVLLIGVFIALASCMDLGPTEGETIKAVATASAMLEDTDHPDDTPPNVEELVWEGADTTEQLAQQALKEMGFPTADDYIGSFTEMGDAQEARLRMRYSIASTAATMYLSLLEPTPDMAEELKALYVDTFRILLGTNAEELHKCTQRYTVEYEQFDSAQFQEDFTSCVSHVKILDHGG